MDFLSSFLRLYFAEEPSRFLGGSAGDGLLDMIPSTMPNPMPFMRFYLRTGKVMLCLAKDFSTAGS
jgi:hypothetical protein